MKILLFMYFIKTFQIKPLRKNFKYCKSDFYVYEHEHINFNLKKKNYLNINAFDYIYIIEINDMLFTITHLYKNDENIIRTIMSDENIELLEKFTLFIVPLKHYYVNYARENKLYGVITFLETLPDENKIMSPLCLTFNNKLLDFIFINQKYSFENKKHQIQNAFLSSNFEYVSVLYNKYLPKIKKNNISNCNLFIFKLKTLKKYEYLKIWIDTFKSNKICIDKNKLSRFMKENIHKRHFQNSHPYNEISNHFKIKENKTLKILKRDGVKHECKYFRGYDKT